MEQNARIYVLQYLTERPGTLVPYTQLIPFVMNKGFSYAQVKQACADALSRWSMVDSWEETLGLESGLYWQDCEMRHQSSTVYSFSGVDCPFHDFVEIEDDDEDDTTQIRVDIYR